jgi:prepilin-type N-terminal cleavage/methylation domain-containing protein
MTVISRFTICRRTARYSQAGFTLLEMAIASFVLVVGLLGGMALLIMAMANNNRSKLDSTATVLSQMTLELIGSVPANSSATVTVVDCNPTTSSASHTVSTAGSSSGLGGPLTSGGNMDFTQSAVSGYSMTYYSCQASTGDRQATYDVRWNVKALTTNAKLVVVAAREIGGDTHANYFAIPVSLRMIVGL